MYRRFLMENPNETIDNMTFYRAIQKYHKDTGVDALLVQCADHNVDAREKVLSNLTVSYTHLTLPTKRIV